MKMSCECNCNLSNCEGGVVYFLKRSTLGREATFTPLLLQNYHFETKTLEYNTEDSIEQYYINDLNDPVEAFYALPIQRDMNVVTVDVSIDGQVNNESKSGIKDYKGDKKSTRYVINWPFEVDSSIEANIFKMKIGLLFPGTGVEISTKYSTSPYNLKLDGDKTKSQSVNYSSNELSYSNFLKKDSSNYSNIGQDDTNEDEDDTEVDQDNSRRWYDRNWGDFGRPWGDFGRPWKVNRKPWGKM